MCRRCKAGRTGYKTTLDIRVALGSGIYSPMWVRELINDSYPRYLVNPFGYILAIQEPDCDVWHLRQQCDDPDVNDNCVPFACVFDTELADAGDSMLFDVRPDVWALFKKQS